MKKLVTFVLLVFLATSARVTDNTLDRGMVKTYLRSGHDNSAVHFYGIKPVRRDGRLVCVYARKIELDATGDGRCDDVSIYRLVRAIWNKNGKLSCMYEYTYDRQPMFTVDDQMSCPDLVASKNGFNFFKNVYFDVDDMEYMYEF